MLHDKCVEEKIFKADASLLASPTPLRHLIHGLPGSGKSELTRWIQNYFEEVWQYKKGEQFVFLAPMNSMANNIGGSTVHSWGQIGFKDMLRGTPLPPPFQPLAQDPQTKSKTNTSARSHNRQCNKQWNVYGITEMTTQVVAMSPSNSTSSGTPNQESYGEYEVTQESFATSVMCLSINNLRV